MDPSLFPDIYPDRPHDPPKTTCCDELRTPIGVPERLWEMTHRLGHSRTPFSAGGLRAMSGATERQVNTAITGAGQRDWIRPVPPESRTRLTVVIYVGHLSKRS
jgi:hypothetical protein